jgi:hypothetical protein
MDALDAIMTRRSIRRYTGEPVTPEQIDVSCAPRWPRRAPATSSRGASS